MNGLLRGTRNPGSRASRRTSEGNPLDIPLAYIDPGSGSLIIQALIASVIAAPFVFRNQLRRAAAAIRRLLSANRGELPKE